MECVQVGGDSKGFGPEHRSRRDDITVRKSSHCETQKLRAEYEQEPEAEAKSPSVVEIPSDDEMEPISLRYSDICHDDDESMFLHVEWTIIHGPRRAR
jgi:hypothetical protein